MAITPSGYAPSAFPAATAPFRGARQPRDGEHFFDAMLTSSVESGATEPQAALPTTQLRFPSMPLAGGPLNAQLPHRAPAEQQRPTTSAHNASTRASHARSRVVSPIGPFPTSSGTAARIADASTRASSPPERAFSKVQPVRSEVTVPVSKTPAASDRAQSPSGPEPAFTAQEETLLLAVAGLEAKMARRSDSASATATPRAARTGKSEPPALESLPGEVAQAVNATPAGLEATALALAGRRYAAGGSSPKSGFDCSGFTSYVYARNGVELPRNSREQFQEGNPVERDKLQPGDLVFFGSKKRIHHVGIYLGDDKFIHSSSGGGSVRVSSMDDPLWEKLYAGARRKR